MSSIPDRYDDAAPADTESQSLAEYVDENREDIEALADAGLPVSPFFDRLLARHQRGDL